MIVKPQIAVVLGEGSGVPLGPYWMIKAARTDFYLEPRNFAGMHLSVHGPSKRFSGHRFHVKVDRSAVTKIDARGGFFAHEVPRDGSAFSGRQVANDVYHVARIRWLRSMQSLEYRTVACSSSKPPDLSDRRSGAFLNSALPPDGVWDLDVYVSFGDPYEPDLAEQNPHGDPTLGPIRNEAGMFLTATSHHHSESLAPTPDGLLYAKPDQDEKPAFLFGGGIDHDIYWFVHSIVSEELIERSRKRTT